MKLFILCCFALIITGRGVNAQTDSSYNGQLEHPAELQSPVQLPVRLFSTYNLNKFPGVNQRQSSILVRFVIYQEIPGQNVSETVLQVLGIACLTAFGDRTNHPYQYPYYKW